MFLQINILLLSLQELLLKKAKISVYFKGPMKGVWELWCEKKQEPKNLLKFCNLKKPKISSTQTCKVFYSACV